MDSTTALNKLLEGNKRFCQEKTVHPRWEKARRRELITGQAPFAVILGCSDSRIPPEVIFDQGLGDLFVIRNAGNTLAPDGLASIEYALAHLGTTLVVVLGHNHCGAIAAAMGNSTGESPALDSLLAKLRKAQGDPTTTDPEANMEPAELANIKQVVTELRNSEPIVSAKVARGEVQVVGMYYRQDDGRVEITAK